MCVHFCVCFGVFVIVFVLAGSIPKPCHLMKPLPQRRVVSAHEDALSMTEGELLLLVLVIQEVPGLKDSCLPPELKAVFQKSPVHLQASGEDQLTCSQVNRQEAPPGENTPQSSLTAGCSLS